MRLLIIMAFLYYNMASKLTIGNVVSTTPVKVRINSSIKNLSDTATIVLPRNYNLIVSGQKTETKNKNITDLIKVGNTVTIQLGYNSNLINEFEGYITEISSDVPLTIKCEDEMWKLKQKSYTKSYRSVKLKELITEIAPGYSLDVVDINLGKFNINNATAYDVLKKLRTDFLLHSYFKDGVLNVGFPSKITGTNTIDVHLGRVKSSSELKFVRKDDFKIQIKAISNNKNGTKEIVTVGDSSGAVRTLNFFDKPKAEIEKLAKDALSSLSFDGYTGSIQLLGQPSAKVGDSIHIIDPDYPDEREGTYLIEEVIKEYSSSGYSQKVKVGMKIL